MKVTPANQTLILASERGSASGLPAATSSQLVRSSGGSAPMLQRLTILDARPDSTMVYLRADFGSRGRVSPAPAAPIDVTGTDVVPEGQTQHSLVRSDWSVHRPDPYGSNRGISLYASTQRMSLDTVTTMRVDVHA